MGLVTEVSQLLATPPGGPLIYGWVDLPGTAGNTLSTPDAAALDIAGDHCGVARINLDDWTPGTIATIFAKEATSASRSYVWSVTTTGALRLYTSVDGAALTVNQTSTVVLGATNGTWVWVAYTHDVNNGAAGNDIRFWYSTQQVVGLDDVTWTQLGTTCTTAGTTTIFNSSSLFQIGVRQTSTEMLAGLAQYVSLRTGIGASGIVGGTEVFRFDAYTDIDSADADTLIAATGQTITVNRSGSPATALTPNARTSPVVGVPTGSGDWQLHVERLSGNVDGGEWDMDTWSPDGWVDLPGATGNYLSAPDAAALDILGDICIVCRIAADDWTPAADKTITGKWTNTGNQRSYRFDLLTTGALSLIWSTTGADNPSSSSTANLSALAGGAWKWVAATLDVNNGAAGRDVRFWTSDDGVAWTQLGATVTSATATSIFNSTALLQMGAHTLGASLPFAGLVQHVSIRTGIGAAGIVGGTEVFRFDADIDLPEDTAATTLTATTGQTITVNRSGTPDTTLVPGDSAEWAVLEWESLNHLVRGMEWFRGADQPHGRPRNGEIVVTLINEIDGLNDPWVNYPNTRPGTILRAGITSATDTRADGWLPQWTGLVESWNVVYEGARSSGYRADSYAEVRLVETLAWLARIDNNALGSAVGSGETIITRIYRLLDAADWPFGQVSLLDPVGEPSTPLQSTDMNANRLSELYLTADSVLTAGAFGGSGIVCSDVTGAALVTTRSTWRVTRLGEFSSAFAGVLPTIAFGATDVGGEMLEVAYDPDSVGTANDPEGIVNDHRYSRVGGTQQLFEHPISIGTFGRSTRARNDLICTTDAAALELAEAANDLEARTAMRVDAVEIVATTRPNALLAVAAIDFGDNVLFYPPNGSAYTGVGNGVVRSMTHTITPMKGRVHWTASYALDFVGFLNLPGSILPEA